MGRERMSCSTKQGVTYQTTDDGTQVENHPEPRNVAALGGFRWVRHHDGSLSAPQQTGAHTEQGTRECGEADGAVVRHAASIGSGFQMVPGEVGSDIDGVANATERQRRADTELVGEGAGEEANYSKGGVQGCVCAVVCERIELASAAHAVEGVEHARAHEAYQRDNYQLHRG
jgi:hypothetical protein